jgi:hypothetical protein
MTEGVLNQKDEQEESGGNKHVLALYIAIFHPTVFGFFTDLFTRILCVFHPHSARCFFLTPPRFACARLSSGGAANDSGGNTDGDLPPRAHPPL